MVLTDKRKFVSVSLKPKLSLEITPLIDVVFLLVCFFMLSSSLGRDQSLAVDLPEAGESRGAVTDAVIISIDQTGVIFFSGKKFSGDNYKTELTEAVVAAKIPKEKIVLIRGDKKSPYDRIVGIMDSLAAAGVASFSLAIVKEER